MKIGFSHIKINFFMRFIRYFPCNFRLDTCTFSQKLTNDRCEMNNTSS